MPYRARLSALASTVRAHSAPFSFSASRSDSGMRMVRLTVGSSGLSGLRPWLLSLCGFFMAR